MAPDLANDAGDDVSQVGFPDEGDPDELKPSIALNVDLVRTVDHDLADRRVSHQAFDPGTCPRTSVRLTDLAPLGLSPWNDMGIFSPGVPSARLASTLDRSSFGSTTECRRPAPARLLPAVDLHVTYGLKYLSPRVGYANLVAQAVCTRPGARGLPSRASACDLLTKREPLALESATTGGAIWRGPRRWQMPGRSAHL